MGGPSWKLASPFGIRVGVHSSWFLVLFLFIFGMSGPVRDSIDASDTTAYLVTVALVSLFFVSIVLHELGHALMARRHGIGVTGIDLFFFGGFTRMARDTESPKEEFEVAIAGPLVTLLISLAAGGGILLVTGPESASDSLTGEGEVAVGALILGWLTAANVFLFVFNLIPAYPLDGGRLARALAWKATGDRERGTRVAATMGQAFSWLLIGVGLYLAIDGDPFNGVMLAVLGWLMGQAARGAVAQTRFSEKLRGVRVADIMDADPVTIPAVTPAARAWEEFFLRYGYEWFAVVERDGRLVGAVHRDAVERVGESSDGDALPVRELIRRDEMQEGRVRDDATLEAVLGQPALRRLGALMAVDDRGRLQGVVTLEQVTRALQARLAPLG